MTTTIVVACAEPFVGEALDFALSSRPRLEVVARTTDELVAAEVAGRLRPQVVLAGLELAAGSGLGLARRLRDVSPTVLLTRRHEGEVLFDVVEAGALGCVHHDVGVDELARLVVEAAAGRFALAPARLAGILEVAVARGHRRAGRSAPVDRLTAREREILALLAQGLDNAGIARRLYLSPQTVRTHVGNVLRKLEVHSRAGAARLALEMGVGAGGADVLELEGPELVP